MTSALRLRWRQLARRPWTFMAAVLSLGIGTGAVTAVHAVVDATLVTPIPAISSQGVVAARQSEDRSAIGEYSYANLGVLQERRDLFAHVAAFGWLSPDQPIEASGVIVRGAAVMISAEYFDVLGVRMFAGRAFTPHDHAFDASPVAIVSHAFWQAQLGSDLAALGQEIEIGTLRAVVVGVMPEGFRGTDLSRRPDIYLPVELMPRASPLGFEWFGEQSPSWLHLIARLQPGVSRETTNAAVAELDRREAHRSGYTLGATFIDVDRAAIPPRYWQEFQTLVVMCALAAAAVLCVACLTVGTLLLVRREEQRVDLAVRLALGASRRHLVLESWIDGLVPTVLGSLLGLPLAQAMIQALIAFGPSSRMNFADLGIHLNARVLMASALTAVIGSSLVTAISCRVTLQRAAVSLLTGNVTTLLTRRHARRVLVLVQVAFAMALLVSAMLLLRSIAALYREDLGYRADGLVEATVDTMATRSTDAERRGLYEDIARQLRAALPAASSGQAGREWVTSFAMLETDGRIVDRSRSARGRPNVLIRTVSPGYLEALGLVPLEGHLFAEQDATRGCPCAVVSKSLARMLAPQAGSGGVAGSGSVAGSVGEADSAGGASGAGGARTAIGRRLGPAAGENLPVVIGVVDDIRLGPLDRQRPTLYILIGSLHPAAAQADIPEIAQRIPKVSTFLVRTFDAGTVARLMRAGVQRWPGAAVDVITTADRIAQSASAQRFGMRAISLLGLVAMLLAMLSIFVLMTSIVVARTRELAIRLAIGATRPALVAMLLRDSLLVVIAGIILGGLGSLRAAQLLRTLLFGVQSLDPISLITAAAILLVVAVTVMTGPIRRASRLAPSHILRDA